MRILNHNQRSSREAIRNLRKLVDEQDSKVTVKHLAALAMARFGISERAFEKYLEILVEIKDIKIIEGHVYKPTLSDKIAPLRYDYR